MDAVRGFGQVGLHAGIHGLTAKELVVEQSFLICGPKADFREGGSGCHGLFHSFATL